MKRLGAILAALLVAADLLACTTAVVTAGASRSGRPMLWKQRDASDPYNIMANVSGGRFAYTGLFPSSDSLLTKCYAGINEAGFAIINNISYNMRPDSLGFNTRAGLLMARALASCVTVDDFMRLLDSEPVPKMLSTNFGVADSHGGAAYFEAGDSIFVRYDVPRDDILFRTNYSLAGDPERGRGRERYETMDYLTEPPGLYDPSFFLHTGRSYLKDGRDVLAGAGTLTETGFIPRTTTVSSIVIECPVREGEKGVLWCATGYTPCCYAIAAVQGEPLPQALQGGANLAAVELFSRVHDGKELKVKPLRRIIRLVERFERREIRLGKLMLRRGDVQKYNEGADRRFRQFKRKLKI